MYIIYIVLIILLLCRSVGNDSHNSVPRRTTYSRIAIACVNPGSMRERVQTVVSRLSGNFTAVSSPRPFVQKSRESNSPSLENVEMGLERSRYSRPRHSGFSTLVIHFSRVPRERADSRCRRTGALSLSLPVSLRAAIKVRGNRLCDPLGAIRATRDGGKRLSNLVLRFWINLGSLITRNNARSRYSLSGVERGGGEGRFCATQQIASAAAANAYLAIEIAVAYFTYLPPPLARTRCSFLSQHGWSRPGEIGKVPAQ